MEILLRFQISARSWCAVAQMLVGLGSAAPAIALPVGRAWTAVETLTTNGHAFMAPDRFEPLKDGRLELVSHGYRGPAGHHAYGLVWQDSTWVQRWVLEQGSWALWPTITPSDHQMLVWKTDSPPVDQYYGYLVTADVVDAQVSRPDTVARVSWNALVYTGTSWGDRRWVAVRDQDHTVLGFPEVLRIFRRVGAGPWRLMGPTGLEGSWGMNMVALDSSTVLVTSGEYHAGVHWGYLRDTTFTEEQPRVDDNTLTLGPSVRRSPDGECLIAFMVAPPLGSDRVVVRRYTGVGWAIPESVVVRYPDNHQYIIDQVVLEPGTSGSPAIVWSGYSPNQLDTAEYLWASLPTDSGLGVGERLDSTRRGVNPIIVRDEFGDAWVAWWQYFEAGLFWMHTYTAARAMNLTMSESAGRPRLAWTLDQPAPGSWWGVLRAAADGSWEQVGRVRAGAAAALQWTDSTAPAGQRLRYSIERLSKDRRHVVRSPEVEWRAHTPILSVTVLSARPNDGSMDLEIIGASAGRIEVRLYDVQGRLQGKLVSTASGAGHDTVRLTFARAPRSGVYLLTVRAAGGASSAPRKIVLLR